MTHVPEIAAGFGITAATLVGYSAWIVRKTTSLARQVEARDAEPERPGSAA
jgi:hypothetical protein